MVDIDTDPNEHCFGNFLRIRVLFDITKPLKRGAKVRLGSGGEIRWVDFKYEKLMEFCYVRGLIGHIARECVGADVEQCQTSNSYPYGLFLCGSTFIKLFQQERQGRIVGN